MKKFILISLILVIPCCKTADNDVEQIEESISNNLKKEIETTVQSFYKTIRQKGFKTPYELTVVIKNTPQFIFFSGDAQEGELVASIWEDLEENIKKMFNEWADGSGFSGEEFFRLNFSWFLIPHELGHYIQEVKQSELNRYEAEIEANKIAVAYWNEKGDSKKVEDFIKITEHIRSKMSKPEDLSKDYFNKNYDEIASKPAVYGYFQFMFYVIAKDSNPKLADFL